MSYTQQRQQLDNLVADSACSCDQDLRVPEPLLIPAFDLKVTHIPVFGVHDFPRSFTETLIDLSPRYCTFPRPTDARFVVRGTFSRIVRPSLPYAQSHVCAYG